MNICKEYCLFILGIYGRGIFDYFYTLVQKQEVQQFIFLTVLFFSIHMLLDLASKKIDKRKGTGK